MGCCLYQISRSFISPAKRAYFGTLSNSRARVLLRDRVCCTRQPPDRSFIMCVQTEFSLYLSFSPSLFLFIPRVSYPSCKCRRRELASFSCHRCLRSFPTFAHKGMHNQIPRDPARPVIHSLRKRERLNLTPPTCGSRYFWLTMCPRHRETAASLEDDS